MSKNYWEAYFNAIKKQDWEGAKNSLHHLSNVERDNPHVHLKIGDIYQRMGDSLNAVASYHQAAWILTKQGFMQKALALYKVILRLDPYNVEAINRSKELMVKLESAKISAAPRPLLREEPVPSLFSSLQKDEIKKIIEKAEIKSFSDSEKVIEEGDSGDSLFIVKSGQARVISHILGKKIELATLSEGDVFGEIAFLTGRPRTASVIAKGPLVVIEIRRQLLEEVIEKNPDVLYKLEDFYQQRLQNTLKKTGSEITPIRNISSNGGKN
ncbi:MAG: cyclic nucleotide-binding domain-containing protein [Nitrospirota bacterium]